MKFVELKNEVPHSRAMQNKYKFQKSVTVLLFIVISSIYQTAIPIPIPIAIAMTGVNDGSTRLNLVSENVTYQSLREQRFTVLRMRKPSVFASTTTPAIPSAGTPTPLPMPTPLPAPTPLPTSIPLPTPTPTPAPLPATENPLPTTNPVSDSMKTMAWIYPGNPACNASVEYADGRNVDVLKSEFFTITGGVLKLLTTENASCNGYSPAAITLLKKYSTEQYATISGASTDDMNSFFADALPPHSEDIATIVNFTVTNNLTGIELDFEGFSSWSADEYQNYKTFVTVLGNALHAQGKKLMLDGPAVSNANEENWFLWRYADFVSLPVDTIVIMAYDYQFDHGVGSPITPLDWLQNVIEYTVTKYPKANLSIGLPSYGYSGTEGSYNSTILTAAQIKTKSGFESAVRDAASGEMTWQNGSTIYFYQDSKSLDMKRAVVVKAGITSVSLWHLGGNPWF